MNFVPGRQPPLQTLVGLKETIELRLWPALKPVLPFTRSLAATLNFQEPGPRLKEDDFQIVWEDAQASAVSRKGQRGSRFQLKYRKQPHAK